MQELDGHTPVTGKGGRDRNRINKMCLLPVKAMLSISFKLKWDLMICPTGINAYENICNSTDLKYI